MKFLLVVLVVAVVVYFVVRFVQDRGLPGRGGRAVRRPRPRPQPPRSVAPDDDEGFLRDLDRKRLDPPDS